jgi:L-amino acid N-acyltransferase YncA
MDKSLSIDFIIEPLQPADWPAVRAIYEEGIATGNATFETTAPAWEQWNQSHRHDCRLVAHRNGQVIGWAALSPVSSRRAYAGVAEDQRLLHRTKHFPPPSISPAPRLCREPGLSIKLSKACVGRI